MRKKHNMQLRKKVLATAITTSLGIASGIPSIAISDTYVWGTFGGNDPASTSVCTTAGTDASLVMFTMLDGGGAVLANSSTDVKTGNQFQTPTCGTLSYDTETETGNVAFGAFDFFAGTLPAVAAGVTFSKLTSAEANGSNTTFLANMLFNWNGIAGIPVSLVWEAQGLIGEMDGTPTSFSLNSDGSINTANNITATGATPASDGTYTGVPKVENVGYETGTGPGGFAGYLNLGPSPIATTAWNTSFGPGCSDGVDSNYADNSGGGCMGIAPSGAVPLELDVATNSNDYVANTGGTTGGDPMADGPFTGMSATFDFLEMKLFSFTDTTPPSTFALNGTASITITAGDTYSDPGVTCTDALPLGTDLSGAVIVGGDAVNPNVLGTYNITYTCQDPSGNKAIDPAGNGADGNNLTLERTVTVNPAGAPTITLLGTTPINHECGTTYTDAGATAADPDKSIPGDGLGDGDITGSIVTTGTINTTEAQLSTPQTISYNVTDSDGLAAATVTRTVVVVDTTAPVVTISGNNPDNVSSSTPENPATYTDQGAILADSCDTSVSGTITATSGSVNMVVPDTGAAIAPYSLTYETTDSSGNIGTATRTVNVERSQPVVTVVGGGVVLNVGDSYVEPGIDIIDAQDGSLTGVTTSGTQSNGISVTIDASAVDTTTEGSYTVTYTVTDSDGNKATLATRDVAVGIFASDSNFTMLDSAGNLVGGTNDVAFDWDGSSFNTDETDTNFDVMTIKSIKPQPFFNFVWSAHHIRIFDNQSGTTQKTLTFDTTCTSAQLEAGMGGPGQDCNGPFTAGQTQQFLTLTIPPGKIGAHILFDWNLTTNIDVVQVWEANGVWNRHGATGETNKLHDGGAGLPPKEDTTWKLVSTDIDGDNINGAPMIDGPFNGFNANFNAGPQSKGEAKAPIVATAPDTKTGSGKLPALALSLWGLLAGFAGLPGLRRFSKQK